MSPGGQRVLDIEPVTIPGLSLSENWPRCATKTGVEKGVYLDTSASTKLVLDEKETPHLRRWMADHTDDRLVSSAITRTELRRAVLRFAQRPDVGELQTRDAALTCTRLLQQVDHIRVTFSILDRAGLEPQALLHSLDAIHLTTASSLHSERKRSGKPWDLDADLLWDRRFRPATLGTTEYLPPNYGHWSPMTTACSGLPGISG